MFSNLAKTRLVFHKLINALNELIEKKKKWKGKGDVSCLGPLFSLEVGRFKK